MTYVALDGPDLTTGSAMVDDDTPDESVEHPAQSIDAAAAAPASHAPIALLVVGVLQVMVLVIAMLNAVSLVLQLAIVADIVLGAVVFGILAAADRRRLVAAGVVDAPPWEWAVVFPPVYLLLRAAALDDEVSPVRAAAILQTVAAVAFLALATVALAGAQPFVSTAGTSRPVIGADVARTVQSSWADAGSTGSVSCDNPATQQEGAEVACRGTYQGDPIALVARLGAPAGAATPVTVVRWTFR